MDKLIVSTDENTITLGKSVLVAKPIADQSDEDAGCEGCYFESVTAASYCHLVPCNSGNRTDDRIVIFIKQE